MTSIGYNKKDSSSVMTGILVPVGSRDEDNNLKGISHFTEHMMFNGTHLHNRDEIKKTIEQYGAEFNAYTTDEHTFYFIKIDKSYAQIARDILNEMLDKPLLDLTLMEKERQIIQQERQMYEDNPQQYIFELANRTLFDQTSGLHLPTIGTKESIDRITREDLAQFVGKYYRQENRIQVEVGAVESTNNQIILSSRFTQEKQSSERMGIIKDRDIQQANMLLTGLMYAKDIDRKALGLFRGSLNSFTGRLFETVREKYGFVYQVYFTYQVFSCGTIQWFVYAALDPKNIKKAEEVIREELVRPYTQEELDYYAKRSIGSRQLYVDEADSIRQHIIDSIMGTSSSYQETLSPDYQTKIYDSRMELGKVQQNLNLNDAQLVLLLPKDEK